MRERAGNAAIIFYALAGAGALWLFFRFLLPWTAPFFIAFFIAALMEPAVTLLCRRWGWHRAPASGLCTLALLGALGLILYLLTGRLFLELKGLAVKTPELLEAALGALEAVKARISEYIDAAPAMPAKYLLAALDSFSRQLENVPARLSEKLIGAFSGLAAKAPSLFLSSATCAIGVYFFSESYPSITGFFMSGIPPGWRHRLRSFKADVKTSLLRWLKVQLIMTVITFAELLAAFVLMRIGYPLLLAAVVAAVDALPVFGAGTVLLPWAAYELLSGGALRGLGLCVTYVLVTVLRNYIQAKLLGDSLGLHPLVTLISVYLGFCAMGVWGMILFPILAITFKQLLDKAIPWLKRNMRDIDREGYRWRE